ncbi:MULTISPECIES: FTR1 family iron permease [Gammaproteobacteria]|uniref:FTR1 family iron permease n=1 Tax=Gammaproteobacteria TaxID=1236 RepID=UPI000BA93D04|nr:MULTISPECIES: FTR1 family protein [Gammaproteobacteria]UJF20347.1 FTR1 family protein [Vibrio sp. SS-MA-C1-2]
MYSSMAIVFREGFEMVLIITLLLAASRQIAHSKTWIISGGITGVFASCLLAYAALSSETIHQLIEAKVTGAVILIFASGLIAWTVIWMRAQGKQLSSKLKESAQSETPLKTLTIVAFLTVIREGGEIVLFLLGLASQNDTSTHSIFLGSLVGAAGAIVVGILMYFGLIRVNISKVFNFFSVVMTFLSAGMMASAVSKLITAGKLPAIIPQLWDTSPYFDHHSNWFALVLHVIFGYTEKPSLLQLATYIIMLVAITLWAKRVNFKMNTKLTAQ